MFFYLMLETNVRTCLKRLTYHRSEKRHRTVEKERTADNYRKDRVDRTVNGSVRTRPVTDRMWKWKRAIPNCVRDLVASRRLPAFMSAHVFTSFGQIRGSQWDTN